MIHGCACPSCGLKVSAVIDSRPNGDGIRRRRKCEACNHRWSTQEVALELATGYQTRDKTMAKAVKALVQAYRGEVGAE